MFPTVVSSEIQRALKDYLRTTFRLRNAQLEAALFEFLSNPESGMFKGPYLDVRLPFDKAGEDWERSAPLDFVPAFVPFAHQLQAFQRLSARDREPRNTLVTTGTGSGKTECFLYPILDHCRREKQRNALGVKAIILYPMNALASDQAERIARLLHRDERLKGVSAGLYVGGQGEHKRPGERHLIDDRDALRGDPPDLLLTNYRMLDFLLMRPEDAPLWSRNEPETLRYLVLDELHTYDGAQGSDVACLIRRLKARLGTPRGRLCCVGTSATIGGGDAGEAKRLLAEFASKIFAEPFDASSVVGETRQTPEQAFGTSSDLRQGDGTGDVPYPLPEPEWAKLTPEAYDTYARYIDAQSRLWFKGRFGPNVLAQLLGEHPFLTRLLRALSGRERRSGPREVDEVLTAIAREDEAFAELPRTRQWLVLSSFVSLIAQARSSGETKDNLRPFLQVQVQLWIREVHGLLRCVSGGTPRFAWAEELKAPSGECWLPMVYCRECGFDAFAATLREGEERLRASPTEIGEAFLHATNRARVVQVLDDTSAVNPAGQATLLEHYLCRRCLRVSHNARCCSVEPGDNLRVRVHPERDDENKPLPLRRCPACQSDSLGFLASRAATLSSVAVSELFTSRFNADKKLLAFTDSVQDASHRAGFFAARTFRFTLRTVIQSLVESAADAVPLESVGRRLLEHWVRKEQQEDRAAALLTPPDLVEDAAYAAYFGLEKAEEQREKHRPTPAQRAALLEVLESRLGWEVTREYGLAVNHGRSLDATVSSTLTFDEARLEAAAAELLELLREHHRGSLRGEPGLDETRHYLEGLLQRLRLAGGILHPWLILFARSDRRYLLSKHKQPRLSRFGPDSQVPAFWVQGEATPKSTYQALHSSPRARSWYRVWTARALGLIKEADENINTMVDRAARVLRDHGLVEQLEGPGARAVFGISPVAARVTGSARRVRCEACGHKLTLSVASAERFSGRPCLSYGCATGAYALDASTDEQESYYQQLYKGGRAVRIFAGEHTGLLARPEREELERAFKRGQRADAPNLLTCTPTLEMGIDIGDLSAVMLCSVPPLPANYVQRVGRAGRSTGNATVLTLVNRRPHDRYFYEAPEEMLRGDIAPPGCFLDAPEMLARQLLAHALDCWARERERGRGAVIPARMALLRVDGDDPFPGQFWLYYQEHKARLTAEFLELFSGEISPLNVERMRQLSQGEGLAGPMKQAFVALKEQLKDYSAQIKALESRRRELEEDPSKVSVVTDEDTLEPRADAEAELSELRDAENAYRRLRSELQNKYPLNVLADAGVIPNYAFPEPGVTLSALLRDPWEEDATERGPGKKVEYQRPASQAIREFAPFNTFYAEGHKIRVTQLDLGNRGAAIELFRICRTCHHWQSELGDAEVAARCPRCDDASWSDIGQRRPFVRFRRALSMMNRLEASTADDAEERERESYRILELIDVGPENCSGARLVQSADLVFGTELLQRQMLREVNLGRRDDTAKPSTIASQDVPQRGFLVCRMCGKVSKSESHAEHTPICPVRRKNDKPVFERLFLYREFSSEAIRLLLPISQLEDPKLVHSLKAALFLGFRKKFRGQPDHLAVSVVDEPRGGERRRFLVIYDTVPGGTGYLADLWKNDGVLDVLERARDAMQACRCARDEKRDGCYRCLYAYQQSHELPHVSRARAVEIIERILAARTELRDEPTLSNARIDDLMESELERRFIQVLQERAAGPGHSWTPTQYGGKSCFVLRTPNSEWLIEPQVRISSESGVFRPSEADFMFRYLGGRKNGVAELPIAVFCDGLRYHVCPDDERSVLGDDIDKRRALLDSGAFRVWSVTWKDLSEEAGVTTLLTRVQRELYQKFFPKSERWLHDDALRGQSSFRLLWEYLEHPDAAVWEELATRFAVSMLQVTPPWTAHSVVQEQERLRNTIKRQPALAEHQVRDGGLPERWGGLDARPSAALFFQITSSCVRSGNFGGGDLTLRLYDDPESRRTPGFEESWRAFLHAWNILQFYPQLPEVVSTEFLGGEGLDERAPPSAAAPKRPPSGRAPADADAYARFAREFRDGAHLARLADLLRAESLPLPVDAAELPASAELDALLAWPEQRMVLVQAATERDLARWQTAGYRALDYDAPAESILSALKTAHQP